MNKAGRKKSEPKGWRWMRLGDISDIISGQSPTSDTYRKKPEGLPFYQGKTDFGLRNPTARVWCVAPKKIAMPGDILISVRAPVGPTNVADVECCIGRGLAIIRCKKNVNAHFVLSFLKLAEEKISQIGTGSVFDSINRNDLLNFQILLPPLAEQKTIAEVLSSLDDKIDLLCRENKTLEDMAQALFRQWFLRGANKDWETGKLGDILEVIESGSRPKGGIDKNIKMGTLSVGAENINGIGNFDFAKARFIPIKFFQKMKKGIVKNYDVLIYKDGAYVGKKAMFGNNFPFKQFAVNEHVFILRANDRANQFYLYFSLEQQELSSLNANSAQPGLNQQAMKSFGIIIPPKIIINKFEQIVKPMIDKILSNSSQIHLLQDLRGTLLPKLISGKVSVRP